MTDQEIMSIADPIMDASTKIDHQQHTRDFSSLLKPIVTKESLEKRCKAYQKEPGYFSKREFTSIFRKETDVRVFWKQCYTKSDNDFVAFIHLVENNDKVEVVNVSVS